LLQQFAPPPRRLFSPQISAATSQAKPAKAAVSLHPINLSA
jgi:hypothetical protein